VRGGRGPSIVESRQEEKASIGCAGGESQLESAESAAVVAKGGEEWRRPDRGKEAREKA